MKTTILRTNASTGNPKPASRLLSFAKMISLLLVIFAVCSTTVSAQSLQKPDQGLDSKVKQTLKKNAETLRFMENKGQIADKNILYYFEGKNGAAYIERNKIHFVANDNEKSPVKKVNGKADTYVKGTHTFTLNLDGANSNAALQLGESFATKYNYFLGRTAKDGVTGIKAAKDLTIREVYPGIDLRLYSSAEGTLEFDWLMKPGADYSKVKLNFTGQDKLTVDQKGNLKVGLRFADVKFNIPESYQVSASGKIPVKFSFTEPEENTIAFATNSRVDPRLALVIDPVLSWGTFMDANNSNFDDYLFAIQVDPVDGMVYCAGNTQRPIPTNAAPYDADGYLNTVSGLSGGTGQSSKPSVAVVYRINSTGTDLVDLTLYGPSTVSGTNQVQAYALSLSANRVFIGGTTNVSIPTAGTPFDNGLSGTSDGYVAVFSRDLGTLTYATYLGGSGDDSRGVTSIRAIDDNSFVVGATVAAALPTSSPNYISGAAQSGFVGTGSNMYIAKFTSLNALSWGTYVGGSGTTTFNDLEILNDNRIAFCGYGTGQFSGTAGVPGEVNSAAARSTSTDEDGIIGVLNSNGSAFNYLDEIGGSANDRINDVEIVGNTLYWTGAAGNGFPISGGKYTSYSGGTSDAIVGKVDAGGSTGYVSTYYGTSGTDLGNGIRLVTQSSCDGSTSSTFLLVFGTVGASGLPTQNINNESFFNSNFTAGGNTGLDMFFAGFTSDLGTLKYGTYMGGNADDYLGATGDPRGANHLWVQGANVFLGTTTHSASHTPTLVSGGFDIGKSNTTNDTHIILGIQFASILLSDYGDAPVSYGVPAHILDNCSKLRIGALIDGEASAANSVGADGDNLNGLNDEDGISTLPLLNGGTGSYSVVVNNILNNYGSAANLYGWIDFNGDGQFQSSEFASTTVANGFSGSKTLTWTGVTVSGDASKHYLRIRLTTDNLSDNAGTTSLDERSTTQAANGEVEDYRCQEFTCPTAQTELPCQTQSAIDTKYAAWLATVRAGGGCSDGVTNNAPANAPKVGIGGTVTVKFTYTSSCGTLSSECTSTFTVQAASNIQLSSSITTPIACNGGGNATVLISATGGSTPYTGTGSFSQAPGTHTYVVSDKNGCGNSIDVTVTQPDPISFTATPVQPSCFGDKGSVTLSTPTGGTGGITFDGTATSNLAPGDYTYTATDANGCKTSHTVHINAAPSAISFTATPVQPTCFGDKGSVTLSTPTGGTGTISFDGTATTNLGEGDYTYTATDENGCKTSHTVHINAAPSAISFTATPVQPTCFGDKGSVTLSTPTGGTGTISFDGTATTNLGEGDYTYTATDENGCKTSHTVHINAAPSAVSCSVTKLSDAGCSGTGTGSATVNATGGSGGYTYLWDNGETTATATALSAGTHSVTVKDVNGCSSSCEVTIAQTSNLVCKIVKLCNISCNGSCNGSAKANISGGSGSYTYLWDNGETTQTATKLCAGVHTVTVTDTKSGCSTSCQVSITEPAKLVATAVATNANCSNTGGSINLTVKGGTAPYTYLWNNGVTTEDLANVPSGNYSVTVTDANKCSTTASASVTATQAPTCSLKLSGAAPKPNSAGNVICATVSGTVKTYKLTVSGAGWSITGKKGANCAIYTAGNPGTTGIFTLKTTDANGCTSTCTLTVTCSGSTSFAGGGKLDYMNKGNEKGSIKAYPNPYRSEINFEFRSPETGEAVLELYDMLGQKLAIVFKGNVTAQMLNSARFDVPAGHRVPMMYKLTVGTHTYHGTVIPE